MMTQEKEGQQANHGWELLDTVSQATDRVANTRTLRMPVPGGWLYRVVDVIRPAVNAYPSTHVSLEFVPHPETRPEISRFILGLDTEMTHRAAAAVAKQTSVTAADGPSLFQSNPALPECGCEANITDGAGIMSDPVNKALMAAIDAVRGLAEIVEGAPSSQQNDAWVCQQGTEVLRTINHAASVARSAGNERALQGINGAAMLVGLVVDVATARLRLANAVTG